MADQLSVREFYAGRSVLVTGGAGFMGKVLVEKLLSSVPEGGRVFLLLRPRRGKTVQQRAEDMLRSPMFNRIKNERKEALEKLIPIQGDIVLEDLGISSEDMQTLLEDVSVVFHLAASLKMEAPLKENVALNTAGTRHALSVARKFKNLAIFVHVSTAFCYPDYKVLEEKFHRSPADPHDVMRLCEWLDERQLELLTPSLLGQQPNTYTFSKRLAETLVHEAHPDVPCVIARPTIVCPAIADPLPGWVDSLNGPVGILLGACKGIIRTMLCDSGYVIPIVPVDTVINGIIALAMIEASKPTRSENIPIYNLNAGDKNPTTWGEVLIMARSYHLKNPLAWPLWYPHLKLTTNRVVHEVRRALFHLAPAYFIDFICLLTGRTRIMVKVQEKVSTGLEMLQYFTMREWHFPCPNFDAIHTLLSKEEDQVYPTYIVDLDSQDYINKTIEAGRVHCFKEDPAKVPFNRKYNYFLYALDTLVKLALVCWALSLLASRCGPVRALLALGEPLLKHVPLLGPSLQHSNDTTTTTTSPFNNVTMDK